MAEDVRAHITGVVFQVVAGVGQKVAAGDPILILESMKMEIPVEAPRAGVVRELRVGRGPDGPGRRGRRDAGLGGVRTSLPGFHPLPSGPGLARPKCREVKV